MNLKGGDGNVGDEKTSEMETLLEEMARFPGICILDIACSGRLDTFIHRLNQRLVRRVKYIVEFCRRTKMREKSCGDAPFPRKLHGREMMRHDRVPETRGRF